MRLKDELIRSFCALNAYNAFNAKKTRAVGGMPASALPLFYAAVFNDLKRPMLIITEKEEEAEELYRAIDYFSPSPRVVHFPSYRTLAFSGASPARDNISERVRLLTRAALSEPLMAIASIEAYTRRLTPKALFTDAFTVIRVGDTISIEAMRYALTEKGYAAVSQVEETGEFAVRGGIIDIFSPAYFEPIRIELFDTEIESIRSFSPETQRSTEKRTEAVIASARETLYSSDAVETRILQNPAVPSAIKERFIANRYFAGSEDYFGFFYDAERSAQLADYFDDPVIFGYDENALLRAAQTYDDALHIRFSENADYRLMSSPRQTYLSPLEFSQTMKKAIGISFLPKGRADEVAFSFEEGRSFKGRANDFVEYIRETLADGFAIQLVTTHAEQAQRFKDMLAAHTPVIADEEGNAPDGAPFVIAIGALNEGFVSKEMRRALMVDSEIFGRKRKRYRRASRVKRSLIESFIDLSEGDYVVHINHGVGVYRGLTRVTALDTEKDFLLIEYAKGDKLYIPVEQINFVQKYASADAAQKPHIDRLGGKAWDKVKARAKKKAEELAKDLIKLYSIRHAINGYAFGADTAWQEDFEASFAYQETPDQIRAIEDVKRDMETPRVMDRLVCGDVGFGKTEVALRAAFKAVMAGKQVAILCPTTVLSQQHYYTARERFKDYPMSVDVLNRFRDRKDAQTILNNLKTGELDIIIGTHTLLSETVVFKDLGLLIVDEEQRFGVKQKETLKRYKTLVDVLTLTATPIPRTLNMALTQMRDISVIETPPLNRLPIQTFVAEFNETTMITAIRRERERGGQIFFVYNRVETIDDFAAMVSKLVPEARIVVAHGQMEGHRLETIMLDFINQKYDILVSTTIIENGIDIANANTILVYRAHELGLSSLYQIRGRVGRSDREAYAYFFYPGDNSITEQAEKRLKALADHTDLGSGFKIAMRDLEIRGGGNALGAEQSGSIAQVGYELYTQLLEEAVGRYKGEIRAITFDTVVDLKQTIYVPDEYAKDEKEKITIYKTILRIDKEDDAPRVREEIEDRYGKLPSILERLVATAKLKAFLKSYNIVSLIEGDYNLYLKCNEYSRIDPEKVTRLVARKGTGVYLDQNDFNQLVIPIIENTFEWKERRAREVVEAIKGPRENNAKAIVTERASAMRENNAASKRIRRSK